MTKPASSRELYLRLLQYVRPYWKAIVLSLCATAIMAATEPMFPALLKPLRTAVDTIEAYVEYERSK